MLLLIPKFFLCCGCSHGVSPFGVSLVWFRSRANLQELLALLRFTPASHTLGKRSMSFIHVFFFQVVYENGLDGSS